MEVNSELKEAQLEIKDTDNTFNANRLALTWFNRATNKIKTIFNSEIKTIATEDWVESQVLDSENALTADGMLMTDQAVDPATPAAGNKHLYAKDDGLYFKDEEEVVHEIEKESTDKIRTVQLVDLAVNETSFLTNAIKTLYAADSDYHWSITGAGFCYGVEQDSNFNNFNTNPGILFDGTTFKGANGEGHYPVLGSGTITTGSTITIQFNNNTVVRNFRGVLTLYKTN
jgi:hypothetical protein